MFGYLIPWFGPGMPFEFGWLPWMWLVVVRSGFLNLFALVPCSRLVMDGMLDRGAVVVVCRGPVRFPCTFAYLLPRVVDARQPTTFFVCWFFSSCRWRYLSRHSQHRIVPCGCKSFLLKSLSGQPLPHAEHNRCASHTPHNAKRSAQPLLPSAVSLLQRTHVVMTLLA